MLQVEYSDIVGCFLQIWKARTYIYSISEKSWNAAGIMPAGRAISLLNFPGIPTYNISGREFLQIPICVPNLSANLIRGRKGLSLKQQSSKYRQTVSLTLIAEEGRDVTCRMFYPYSCLMTSAKCGSFTLLQL